MCVEAYAAALLDGEGSIHVDLTSRGLYQLTVSFGMADDGPLHFLASRWGGGVKVGQVTAKGRKIYKWQATGAYALEFLQDVKSWVQGKSEQVELALGFPMCELGKGYHTRNGRYLPVEMVEARRRIRDGLREIRAVR